MKKALSKKEKAFKEKHPLVGMFRLGKNASEKIDEAICDEIEGKFKEWYKA